MRWISLFGIVVLFSPIQAKAIDFTQEIRPLLSDRCFKCHGPDEQTREADLRLDIKESATTARDGVIAVAPGDIEQSELIARIFSDDEYVVMPPPDAGVTPLTPEEKQLLKDWISDGATWSEHWAFVAPKRPEVPKLAGNWRIANPIDAFVCRKLEQQGLTQAPPADDGVLYRRLSLDLIGLPPSLTELENYLASSESSKYKTEIERMLQSPHYGEHMTRYWLDLVRYGDTHGMHLDNYREMWPYRDWVIDSFNRNMPYDQFITEQLAGDLLESPSREQLIASGFNRLNVTTSEGGSIYEEVYVRNVVDRVDSFGTIFLGMTTGCAVCHDHKFDPLSMRDFYQLFAFFNSIDGRALDGNKKDHPPVIKVPSPQQEQRLAELTSEIQSLNNKIIAPMPELDERQIAWEQDIIRSRENQEWLLLSPTSVESESQSELVVLEDQSIVATGYNPSEEVYTFVGALPAGKPWQSLQLEVIVDPPTNPRGGRSPNGNAVLTEINVEVGDPNNETGWRKVSLVDAWADHEQPGGKFQIKYAIDGKTIKDEGWAIEGHGQQESRVAKFLLEKPVESASATPIRISLIHKTVWAQHQFERFRFSIGEQNQVTSESVPKELLAIITKPTEQRSAVEQNKLKRHYREQVAQSEPFKQLLSELEQRNQEKTALDQAIPTTLIYKELKEPRAAYILTRGEYDKKGEQVERLAPASLPQLPEGVPANRLGLAKWLVSEEHPLTARVAVNRLWQQFFGTGLVKTAEDFGSQGEFPSHPELLDWLAIEFRESGWDVQHIVRLIVTSETYRQSSATTPEKLRLDPANRLLARAPRYRLDGEHLRDQALALSGSLVPTIGGPSVKPPQPAGLWEAVGYTSSNTARFKADEGAKIYRRSLYTFWKRTSPPPTMTTFDAPSREACTARRERTNTPLQALVLLNEEQFFEAALRYAKRSEFQDITEFESRLETMFKAATARKPSPQELAALASTWKQLEEYYSQSPDAMRQLLASEDEPTSEFAAWAMIANLILNLDEVVSRN